MLDRTQALDLASVADQTPREVLDGQAAAAPVVAEQLELVCGRVIESKTPLGVGPDYVSYRLDLAATPELLDATLDAVVELVSPKAAYAAKGDLRVLGDSVQADTPIRQHPAFREALDLAAMHQLGATATFALAEGTVTEIYSAGARLSSLTDADIDALAAAEVVDPADASTLRRAMGVFRAVGGEADLALAVAAGFAVNDARALADLALSDWHTVVDTVDPAGTRYGDAAAYAETLRRRVRRLYPSAAFARAAGPDLPTTSDLDTLDGLVADHGATISVKDDVFDPGTLDDAVEEAAARAIHARLVGLARRYRGFAVGDILDGPGSAAVRHGQLVVELADVQQLFVERPEVLTLDLVGGAAALDDFLPALDPDRRAAMLATARDHQRMLRIVDDVDDTLALLDAGIRSAFEVVQAAARGKDELAERTGLSPEIIDRHVAHAGPAASRTMPAFGAVVDAHAASASPYLGNADPAFRSLFRDLPGYDDLFGEQSFCRCEHCRSILSPAAYFVDVLGFIEEHVLTPHFADASHPLHLRARRPDLWTLPLTCDNTHTPVRTLELVVEVLERAVARFERDDSDGDEVDEVYASDLATLKFGPTLPYDRDHDVSRVALEAKGLSFEAIARVFAAGDTEGDRVRRLRARYGLSPSALNAITAADDQLADLQTRYGISFALDADEVEPVGAGALTDALAIDRQTLTQMLAARFVCGAASPVIEAGLSEPGAVQPDVERVSGLTPALLDRLERFARLHRVMPLNVFELDFALSELAVLGIGDGLDETAIDYVDRLARLTARHDLAIDEAVTLFGVLPTHPVEPDGPTLVARLFNTPAQLALGGPSYPDEAESIVVSESYDDPQIARLALGTGLDRFTLAALLPPLSGDSANPSVAAPSVATLTNMLAMATMLRVVGTNLWRYIYLSSALPPSEPGSPDEVFALAIELRDTFAAWARTPWSGADEADFFFESPFAFTTTEDLAAANALIADLVGDANRVFDATLLAHIEDIDEAQSRAFVALNAGVGKPFTAVESRYRLSNGYTSANLDLGDLTDFEAEIIALLDPFRVGEWLRTRLAERLDMPLDRFDAITMFTVAEHDLDALFEGVLDDPDAHDETLAEILTHTRLWGRLLASPVLTPARIAFIHTERAAFGIDGESPVEPSLVTMLRIDAYRRVIEAGLPDGAPSASLDAALIKLAVHRRPESAGDGALREAAAESLGRAFGCAEGVARSILSRLTGELDLFEAWTAFGEAASILDRLQIDSASAVDLIDKGGADLAPVARALESLVGPESRVGLLSGLRDALVTALVRSPATPYASPRDLYAAFLIDVETSPCAETTRVAAAIDAIQSYANRVTLNLEVFGGWGGFADVAIPPAAIPSDQWAWRKNYRVWEANRKVFLYPENYLEPGVRDDKTSLFETLEEMLASRPVDETAIEDAYAAYLKGFEELARLRFGGAYHEVAPSDDVLHLFGVDSQDPPNWYYRRVAGLRQSGERAERGTRWGAWTPLGLKIPVRRVSPVVYRGRLYVFWLEVVTQPYTRTEQGSNDFLGYQHQVRVLYAVRRPDDSWSAPQQVEVRDVPIEPAPPEPAPEPAPEPDDGGEGDGGDAEPPIVGGPPDHGKPGREPEWQQESEGRRKSALARYRRFSVVDDMLDDRSSPRFDDRTHLEPLPEYTLDDPPWVELHPHVWRQGDEGLRIALRGFGYQLNAYLDLHTNQTDPDPLPLPYTLNHPDNPPTRVPRPGDIWNDHLAKPHFTYYVAHDGSGVVAPTPVSIALFDEDSWASLLLDPAIHATTQSWSDPLKRYIDDASAPLLPLIGFERRPNRRLSHVPGAHQGVVLQVGGTLLHLQASGHDGRYPLRRLDTDVAERMNETLLVDGLDALLDIDNQMTLEEPPASSVLSFMSDEVADLTGGGALDFTGPMGVYLREVFFHIPMAIAAHLHAHGRYDEARRWYEVVFAPSTDDEVALDPELPPEERAWRALDRVWRFRWFRGLDRDALLARLTDDAAIAAYEDDPFNPHAIARHRPSAYQKAVVLKTIDNLLAWGDALFTRETRESLAEALLLYTTASELLGPRPRELGDCPGAALSYADLVAQGDVVSDFIVLLEDLGNARRANTAEPGGAATPGRARRVQVDIPLPVEVDGAGDEDEPVFAVSRTSTTAGQPMLRATTVFDHSNRAVWLLDFLRQKSLAFCIPPNAQLFDRWDRLEDRLYKLRNCLRLDGSRRHTAPFAPPIDPAALVRARASGMAVGDLIGITSPTLPPYRFRALIGRAKQYAGTVQRLGGALAAALERRDAEDLSRLRQSQQREITALTTEIRDREIEAADAAITALERQRDAIRYRIDHYAGLIEQGNLASEDTQLVAQMTSLGLRAGETLWMTVAGALGILPQGGSPFAITYGGKQLSTQARALGNAVRGAATAADTTASIAGAVASYARREQGWKLQQALAERELATLDPQLEGARIRRRIAERSALIHERSVAHLDEVLAFFDDKATNLELFSALARALQAMYRQAYDAAMRFARLTEAAYHFERDTADSVLGQHWSAERGGLLAGDGLMLDLERLERRFLETHDRTPEINQNFSLAQVDPKALLALRATGATAFSLPEYVFDLFYPGHYRRRIRAVRLTLSCTGEITTNISARLDLVGSKMRTAATGELVDVPTSRSTTMATSTGEGDAGVFAFEFEGERYMPFEGMGAISTWALSLPKRLRPFDYGAITDVVLNLSYVARDDAMLRTQLEDQDELITRINTDKVEWAFSLREYASSVFYVLAEGDGTQATLSIRVTDLPHYLRGSSLLVDEAQIVVETDGALTGDVEVDGLGGSDLVALTSLPNVNGGLPTATLTAAGQSSSIDTFHDAINEQGDFSLRLTTDVDAEAIRDIVIVMTLAIGGGST